MLGWGIGEVCGGWQRPPWLGVDRPRRILLWEKHGEPLGPKFDVLGGRAKICKI